MRGAYISGWEYLDKIVQLPFSLPEPPPRKVQRLVESCLVGNDATPAKVAARLVNLIDKLKRVEVGTGGTIKVRFVDSEDSSGDGTLKETNDDSISGSEDAGSTPAVVGPDEAAVELKKLIKEIEPLKKSKNPTVLVRAAAKLLCEATRNAETLVNALGDEGVEIMCNRVNDAVQHCDMMFIKSSETNDDDGPSFFEDPTSSDVNKEGAEQDTDTANEKEDPAVMNGAVDDSEAATVVPDDKAPQQWKRIELDKSTEPQRVTPNELAKFVKFIAEVDRNPRRLKRIVNIYQVIVEVAKHMPIQEDKPQKKVVSHKSWPQFCAKLIKWICLCECYPYRMSLLVLVVEDYEQKGATNDVVNDRRELGQTEGKLMKWYETAGERDETTALPGNKLASSVYFEYADPFVFAHKHADEMSRLDSDVEQFTKLMMMPCTAYDDITVDDILGPLSSKRNMDQSRDANFSLLSYSFNLNSAMRGHLASVRSSHLTESELEPSDAKHTSATDPSLRLPHSKGTQEYVRVRQEDMKRRQSTLQFFCNT